MERRRSKLLSIWLVFNGLLFAILALVLIVTVVNEAQNPASTVPQEQQWAGLALAVLSIINVGATVALWNWRRIGYYIFIVTGLLILILNLWLGMQLLVALFPVYLLSTLWTLLKPYWNDLR